jgi:hypothetical protein
MPSANNTAWGFWGTIARHAEASEAWALAIPVIMSATGFSEEAVRDFLDSWHGRHFADDVAQRLFEGLPLRSAIEAVVDRWLNWKRDSCMQAQSSIPVDLPYLVGLVGNCEIENEVSAA